MKPVAPVRSTPSLRLRYSGFIVTSGGGSTEVDELIDRLVDGAGEEVGVEQLAVSVKAEACTITDRRDADRKSVAVRDRDHRICLLQLAPEHVHRLGRARDVRD